MTTPDRETPTRPLHPGSGGPGRRHRSDLEYDRGEHPALLPAEHASALPGAGLDEVGKVLLRCLVVFCASTSSRARRDWQTVRTGRPRVRTG
jgi:hypothetical protein